MTKQKVGLTLFWIAVSWAVAWGVIGSILVTEAHRNLSMDELNQTMWAIGAPGFIIWGIFGVPVAALLALIGLLLNSGARASTEWKYGAGGLAALVFSVALGHIGHVPAALGFGGALILLCFFGILWFRAKERKSLNDASSSAADLKMFGYVFLLIGTWFTCGLASQPYMKAIETESPYSPLLIMVTFVLGWLFVFLGHYKARRLI